MAKKKEVKAAEVPSVNQFELDGKKYIAKRGVFYATHRGTQKLTAADICVSEEVQKYLVSTGSSIIEEVAGE